MIIALRKVRKLVSVGVDHRAEHRCGKDVRGEIQQPKIVAHGVHEVVGPGDARRHRDEGRLVEEHVVRVVHYLEAGLGDGDLAEAKLGRLGSLKQRFNKC